MENMKDRGSRLLSHVYKGLLLLLILLVLGLIGGTIYGVFFKRAPQNSGPVDIFYEGGQTFTGIGQIRVSTADPQPGIVIIFVSFSYYPEDIAFSEELALRVGDFRNIIVNYIGSLSVDELQTMNEEHIKAELLRRFNAVLRLGQIDVLFFSDFLIVG